ncbi:hypothetical protein RQ831_15675 [Roseomonas gilardii]|uniref:Uncharacterized protein n=1 Tax=Roseomonas gilardii TaxID=257708 RepID=A0ABU3MJ79_9PROT|nr:hypothetical protein [Roseomonas gilardii]MDT8332501.1 hypothetical protein [Roseomonas gilardii]
MTQPLPSCVSATRRRPLPIVFREATMAGLLGLLASWGLAELALLVQGY